MYGLATFSLSDMIEAGAELRKLGAGAVSLQEVAERITHYFYHHFGDDRTGKLDCALVRFFKTHSYGDLPSDLQGFARAVLGHEPDSPDVKCLTLLGTAGEQSEWNERQRSQRHQAIPLASKQFVRQFPMISQLFNQFGSKLELFLEPDPALLVDWEATTFNVFYVPDAVASPFVPAQEQFVIPYGIRSVVGVGGMLPSGEFFAVVLFSKVVIPQQTADLFKTLAQSAKIALLPYDGRLVFGSARVGDGEKTSPVVGPPIGTESELYRIHAEALEQLLVVHEQTVIRNAGQRKQSEEALLETEERYRSIFESAIEGIFQATLDGRYVAVNPALARMYGYDSPEDMIAAITDIASQVYVDPGRRDELIRLMQEQEEITGFEMQVGRRDGSFIWVSKSVRALRDPDGVPVGYRGTVENITERKLANQRLHDTLDHVRTLGGRLTTVQEEERTRIARELHDELGVGLTCLKIDLSRLAAIVGDGIGADAHAKLDEKVRSMVEQVDGTIAAVQRLVTQLRPAVLDHLGLVAAIEWQCQDFQKRTGIPCTCVTSADDIAMDAEQATALFRICQEALTNIARHAQATAVTVKLESKNASVQLMVIDNGRGIPDTKVSDRQSLGLLGMRERVALFGGEITIQGSLGKGTAVTVWLPHRQMAEHDPMGGIPC